ncbi:MULTISPECIES: helix-turn-helix domain-containing protein [Leuconostoc]|uniref:HTH cro/C1-type domain-containing protein n=2 Tax=Leuconostoc kimchii TaxID=136609 RepID=D5T1U7_LEUKI|nr:MULTISPECIES: helix-turn-helix transcriptional regulator [Leuconostoc]ADG40246.1 hypothetical protein LKI_03520 [Leuconostoc kimchii IMSNU 11154]AEJ31814.1 hypothetical protein LGMK_08825 [Leuconostoc sp. C2]QBR46757.1 XRE family transcriptional regulator [Leuconostoc kimchii]
MNQNVIGNKIKELRTLQNLTQFELAEKANLSISLISKIEIQEENIKINTLQNIAKALNTTVESLLKKDNEYALNEQVIINKLNKLNNESKQDIEKIINQLIDYAIRNDEK